MMIFFRVLFWVGCAGLIAVFVMFGRDYSVTVYDKGNPTMYTASASTSIPTPPTTSASPSLAEEQKKTLAGIQTALERISTAVSKIKVTSHDKMPPNVKWGVYTGWHEKSMTDFELLTGKQPQMEMVFVHWGNENVFPQYYAPRIRDKGRTMVLFWEASDYKRDPFNQEDFTYDNVLSGKLDPYFVGFASGAKLYGGEIILIPYSEFNGNWYSWAGTVGSNTPEKHNEAYRYIHKFFKDVPNVKFGWAPNANSVPDTANNRVELYYPGDEYVDYVGVDGFNFGGEHDMTFKELFGPMLKKLMVYKKPIYIFSFATVDSPNKAKWIKTALTEDLYEYPEVKGWLWFHQNKEEDWRINSDSESLKAFVSALP